MKISASQAAKKTGKSVPTITRAIKSGKISAEKTTSGGYQIDTSELFRVFRPIDEKPNVKDNNLQDETPKNPSVTPPELHFFEEKLKLLEAALADAKAERDEWREQAKRLTLSLPPPTDSEQPSRRRRWWHWAK